MAKRGQSKYMKHMRARALGQVTNAPDLFGTGRVFKGMHGKNCNVTSCQQPNSAWWWNHSTHKWYCSSCARAINEANAHDSWWIEHYDHPILTPPEDVVLVHNADSFSVVLPNSETFDVATVYGAEVEAARYRMLAGLRPDGSLPMWYIRQSTIHQRLRQEVVASWSK